MPAVDLRELVKAPIELTGRFPAPANSHPLHEGLNETRRYTSDSASPIILPHGGRGLERLRQAVIAPVPGIDAERSLEAYVRLLAGAPAIHTAPGAMTVGPDGTALPEEVSARTRSVLLTGVFRDPDEKFIDQTFSSPRFAAVGTLTVIPNPEDNRRPEDAWLNISWVHSSRSMLTGLLRIPGLMLVPARRNRRIEILIAEDLVEEQPGFSDQVKQLALMLGANPIVHVTTVKGRGTITAKINSNNPHELIALGSAVDENIVSTFTRRNGDRDLHRAVCTSADAALQWLLDELPRIMGVGPGLMSYPEVEALPGRPILPVAKPTRCLHHGENHYVLDGETDWWWTRDFAQHGSEEKCVFKTYVLVDGELLWNADHDADGNVIADKHKGRVGKKIAESATSSCGFPAKHLR